MSDRAQTRAGSRAANRPQADARKATRGLIAGVPQVSLLPSEVREAGSVRKHRSRLVAVVIVAGIAAAGAVVGANGIDDAAQERLAVSTAQTQTLTAQLGRFDGVRDLERRIALGEAGVTVGSSTRIDWSDQLAAIQADMPIGYTITAIGADGATPLGEYTQGSSKIELRRAATFQVTVETSTVGDEFSVWLRKLREIPAYADLTATTSKDEPEDGSPSITTIDLVVHLNQDVIDAPKTESK